MDIEEVRAPGTKKVAVDWDENGDPKVGFIIVSKDSKEYRGAAAKQRAAAIRRQAVKKSRIDRTTEEGALEMDNVVQSSEFAVALAVVVDWFGFTQSDGNGGKKPADFSKERVEHMLTVRPTWREEITKALEEPEGFTPS